MIKLLLIVAWRNFCRDKLTSFIQLFGLAIGLCCFIITQQYVSHQQSFNTLFTDAEKIYRINLIRDENKPQALTPIRLAQELNTNFEQINDATHISIGSVSVKHQQSVFSERAMFVANNYFEFFDFELLAGDKATALNAPNSLVLYEDTAIKYFGTTQGVIGKMLEINQVQYQITGVIKKTNQPHTMPLNMLLPIKQFVALLPSPVLENSWSFNATITFAKIADQANVPVLTNTASDYYQERTRGISSYKSNRITFNKLTDIYLDNNVSRTLIPPGSKTMVQAFSIVSLLILVLACVNFTNLATAAAIRKAKDVGVRKALGASKLQLITQYLVEAVMISTIATAVALILALLLLPAFNVLMATEISLQFNAQLILQLGLLTLVFGLIAGLYPAFYLSQLPAALVLKGLTSVSKFSNLLRHSLIVMQFAIAAFLLVASMIVNNQMQFVKDMPQGYERENVIIVSRGAEIFNAFKTRALRHPGVVSVSMSHTVPTKATRTSHTVRRLDDISNEIWVGNNPVSYDYFETFGIKLLAGRDFSLAYSNDAYKEDDEVPANTTGKIIINETLAAQLGWSAQEAVDQVLSLGNANEGLHNHQIIAVAEDSHYVNAKNAVPPMLYVLSGKPQDLSLRWVSIRFKAGASYRAIEYMEQIWLSLDNDLAFKWDWLEELFNASYRNENQQSKLLTVFTLLAITVTAIGLFGLAAFTTQKRVKEIAIRRILGAETSQLCLMLVNQFAKLVIIANIIALPIGYLLMRDWLNDFIYRIEMPYFVFIQSIIFSLAIAYITVSTIAYRAASSKPVDSLTYE